MILKDLLRVTPPNQLIKVSYVENAHVNELIKPCSVIYHYVESLHQKDVTCIYANDKDDYIHVLL